MKVTTLLQPALLLVHTARAALLWDGRFNDLDAATDLNEWSWANQVGPYQYYSGLTSRVILFKTLIERA